MTTHSKLPYVVGLIGTAALAFVIGLFVGRGSGVETAAPVIDGNVVTRARAPDENALIAANAERADAQQPAPAPAQPERANVQEAAATLERPPVDSFEEVEEAIGRMDDGGKRDGKEPALASH